MEFIIDILQLIGFLIVAPITALILIDALTTIVITNSHSDFKSILDDVEFMVEYGEYTMLFPIKGSDTKIQFISKIPNIFNDNIDKISYKIMNVVSLYRYQIILKNNIRIRGPIWSKTHNDINRILVCKKFRTST